MKPNQTNTTRAILPAVILTGLLIPLGATYWFGDGGGAGALVDGRIEPLPFHDATSFEQFLAVASGFGFRFFRRMCGWFTHFSPPVCPVFGEEVGRGKMLTGGNQ